MSIKNLKKVIQISMVVFLFIAPLYSQQIADFDFTTMEGPGYNLYNDLINKKRPVLFHTTSAS